MDTNIDLMWGRWTERLYDELIESGLVSEETGEPHTLKDVDWAIQDVMETVRLEEGWSGMPDMDDRLWWSIVETVIDSLGFDIDQVREVAA